MAKMNAWGRSVAIDPASRLKRLPRAATDRVIPNFGPNEDQVGVQACGIRGLSMTNMERIRVVRDFPSYSNGWGELTVHELPPS